MTCDHRVRLAPAQCQHQLVPRFYLDIARCLGVETDGARKIDVETGKLSFLVKKIEGREIAFRHEPQHQPPGQIGCSLARLCAGRFVLCARVWCWQKRCCCREKSCGQDQTGKHGTFATLWANTLQQRVLRPA